MRKARPPQGDGERGEGRGVALRRWKGKGLEKEKKTDDDTRAGSTSTRAQQPSLPCLPNPDSFFFGSNSPEDGFAYINPFSQVIS